MKRRGEPKIRFVCELSTQVSELFTVKQRPNGALVITNNSAEFILPTDIYPHKHRIINQKYSAHLSNGGSSTTLHHTIVLEGGTELDTCIFQNDHASLACPLFARACSDLSAERYKLRMRPKDSVVKVAKLPLPVVFVFCLLISGRTVFFAATDFPLLRLTSVPIDNFSIHVVHGIVPVASFEQGTLVHFMTNSPRKDKEFMGVDVRGLGGPPLQLDKAGAIAASKEMLRHVVVEHANKLRSSKHFDSLGESHRAFVREHGTSLYPSVPRNLNKA